MKLPKPYGYITAESERRFLNGGNESRGTVPLHRKESNVSCIPLYTLDQMIAMHREGKKPLEDESTKG